MIGQVTVQKPKVTLASWDRMHEICGEGYFDACTRFIAWTLDAGCVARDDGASIVATVTFRPWIVLHDIHRLDHEQEHIEDIRGYADGYIKEIEQNGFRSKADCQAAALAAMSGFGEMMRAFALRSNLMRHPILREAP